MANRYLAGLLLLIGSPVLAAPPTPEEIALAKLNQRIAKLEARLEAQENLLRPGRAGTPSSLEAPQNLSITAQGDSRLLTGKNLQIIAQDSIVIKSGGASITLRKNGDIEILGGRLVMRGDTVDVKGQQDVRIKGKAIANN